MVIKNSNYENYHISSIFICLLDCDRKQFCSSEKKNGRQKQDWDEINKEEFLTKMIHLGLAGYKMIITNLACYLSRHIQCALIEYLLSICISCELNLIVIFSCLGEVKLFQGITHCIRLP